MVRDADTERVVHRASDTRVNSQVVARREPLETGNAGFPVPRTQADGMEVVDAIGQTEAADERL